MRLGRRSLGSSIGFDTPIAHPVLRTQTRSAELTPMRRLSWWVAVVILSLTILAAASVVVGRVSGGRLGMVFVQGNSLAKYIPEGSAVVILPLPLRIRTFATAVTEVPDDVRDVESGDRQRKLSVKWFDGHRMVSTDSSEHYSRYDYRGRVVAVLPIQRLCPWLDKGAQAPTLEMSDEQRAEAVAAENRRKAAREQSLAARGLVQYVPGHTSSVGSVFREDSWTDPRVVPEQPITLGSTFVEFTLEAETLAEITLGPVAPTKVTLDGKPAEFKSGWLKPGNYRLTWIYPEGSMSDTPSVSFRFLRRK